MSSLMESHLQELLLSNASTVREKAKLAQMEIDGKDSVVSWVAAKQYALASNA